MLYIIFTHNCSLSILSLHTQSQTWRDGVLCWLNSVSQITSDSAWLDSMNKVKEWMNGQVIYYFPYCWDQYWGRGKQQQHNTNKQNKTKSNVRKKSSLLCSLRGESITMGKAWWQEHEAVGDIASTAVRKQRATNTGTQLYFSVSFCLDPIP